MDIQLAYVTVASREEAEKIAQATVTEKLAACANILPETQSFFEWDGNLCQEDETILILKTTVEKKAPLTARIKELHSYSCPCIVFLPTDGGNPDFLQWVSRSAS